MISWQKLRLILLILICSGVLAILLKAFFTAPAEKATPQNNNPEVID